MILIALLPLFVAALQVESRPSDYSDYDNEMLLPLDAEQEECIAQLNLDREMMAFFSTQEFPPENDQSLNEFFSCSWKKHGYQYENGQINYDALEKMTRDALYEQAGSSSSAINLAKSMAMISVSDCKQVQGSSHGQTAVKVHNCIYRRLLELAKQQRKIKYPNSKESMCILGADFVNADIQNKRKCNFKGFL